MNECTANKIAYRALTALLGLREERTGPNFDQPCRILEELDA